MRNRHLERRLLKERIQDGFILPEVYSKYREMVDASFPHLNEEQKDAETRIICHTHPDSPHVQTPAPDPKLQPAKRDAKLLPVLVGGLLIMGQIIALLLAVLIYLVLFSDKAHATGTSQIDVIKVTDGVTTLTAAAPFKMTFSGCAVSGTGSAWAINCTGGAANPGGSAHQIQVNLSGTGFAGIANGTAGQVLCSNGTTNDPAMCDPVVSGPDAVGAASTKPPVQVGCIFLTTPATLTNNQVGALQCDSVQNLLVKVVNSITGTVTANAGTNLNTSLLALEAGGNLAAIKTDVDKIPTLPATDRTTAAAPFAFELSDGAAFYTGTKTGQLPAALDGSGFLKTHEQGALPAGTNVIGHVIADTGSTTVVTGNVAVTKADGSDVTLGAKADAKSTATDTTAVTAMQVLKEISAMEQAPASRAVTNAGTFAVQESTLDGAISGAKLAVKSADGDQATIGTKTDAAATQTDATSVSVVSILKEISAKAQAPASTPVTGTFFQSTQPVSCANGATCPTNSTLQAGSAIVGKVGIDQTTPGTTNAVQETNLPATVDTNSGNKSASTIRVVVATDQPNLTTALNVNCTSGCTAGGSFADNSAFTPGSTAMSNTGGVYNESLSPVTSGNGATARITGNRALHETPMSPNGVPLGTNANPIYVASLAPLVPPTTKSQLVGPFGPIGTPQSPLSVQLPPVSDPCAGGNKRNVPISVTANTQLFNAPPTGTAKICSIMLISTSAETFSIVGGTGSTCGTGVEAIVGSTTAANGPALAANGGYAQGVGMGTIAASNVPGNNVCILISGSTLIAGNLVWAY